MIFAHLTIIEERLLSGFSISYNILNIYFQESEAVFFNIYYIKLAISYFYKSINYFFVFN